MADLSRDFGSYLVAVAERDVDLLLMEEFHANPAFVSWFCEQLRLAQVEFDGAWHSVFDADGETDLLLRVLADNRRVGILIENKIGAPEQVTQDQRYHLRGARSQQERKFDTFLTCMCAPQNYLDNLSEDTLYQHKVSYESISDWFSKLDGARAAWRHHIMQEAIAQSRRGYTMVVNPVASEFHMAYWQYLRRNHPRILMQKPTPKGSKSTWIILKLTHFPKGVRLHHKLDQSVIELGFDRRDVSEILATGVHLPERVYAVQKGKTASLAIDVPRIEMANGVAAQENVLEEVARAINVLEQFARLFEGNGGKLQPAP